MVTFPRLLIYFIPGEVNCKYHHTDKINICSSLSFRDEYSSEDGYWIGVSDQQYESDFFSIDGRHVQFTSKKARRHFLITILMLNVRFNQNNYLKICNLFLKKNGGHKWLGGAIDTPVLDFWWHLPWVSKPGCIPHLHAFSPACNGFLRFTSGATPADPLTASMAASPVPYMHLVEVKICKLLKLYKQPHNSFILVVLIWLDHNPFANSTR